MAGLVLQSTQRARALTAGTTPILLAFGPVVATRGLGDKVVGVSQVAGWIISDVAATVAWQVSDDGTNYETLRTENLLAGVVLEIDITMPGNYFRGSVARGAADASISYDLQLRQ